MAAWLLVCLTASAAAAGQGLHAERVPTPAFRTEVVAFEDTFLYPQPRAGSMVYRFEGTGRLVWRSGRLVCPGGPVSCVHPALYARPALRMLLRVDAGEPGIAIAHNGMRDVAGQPNARPGVEVVLRAHDTAVRDLVSGRTVARVPAAFPRGREARLTVAWDAGTGAVRLDLPGGSWRIALPAIVGSRGGFGLRAPARPATVFTVRKLQVLWQDDRPLVLYDGYDTVYDRAGARLGTLPSVVLPAGSTHYATASYDLRRERSLILFGASDLNSDHPETIRGYAVRELRTGRLLHTFGPRINGCQPQQGGGSIEGQWVLQSWTVPASLSWIDWDAYDRGDLARFVTPYKVARQSGSAFVGYHDPSNALDGSLVRYLRITESWVGVNRFTVPPALLPFAPLGDVAMPAPTHPLVSQTGPAGMPAQLAVRDRDRAWYELWAYRGSQLHVQSRGYNVFARRDDWQGPFGDPDKAAPPFEDFVNMTPDLLRPGHLLAPRYRFSARLTGAARLQQLGLFWLRWLPGRFVPESRVRFANPALVAYQILLDTRHLRRVDARQAAEHD